MPKADWKAYFPDDGEGPEDARALDPSLPIFDAEDAAADAAEYDFHSRSGWERREASEFTIVVISPEGVETHFMGWHEPSVEHRVRQIQPGESGDAGHQVPEAVPTAAQVEDQPDETGA